MTKPGQLRGLALAITLSAGMHAQAADMQVFDASRAALEQAGATVRTHTSTGAAAFIGLSTAQKRQRAGLPPGAALDDFLDTYASAFGLTDHRRQLRRGPLRNFGAGGSVIALQQVHEGIDVFGGMLKAHYDRSGALHAIGGFVLSDFPAVRGKVVIGEEDASKIALNSVLLVASFPRGQPPQLEAASIRDLWYHDGVLRGQSGAVHRVYEVLVSDSTGNVREFLYIDAYSGKVLNQITGIHTALNRELYEGNLGNLIWTEGDSYPMFGPYATDWNNELDGARESYNLFSSLTSGSWPSYDGASATMMTVNNAPISCPNALWNGELTAFCAGLTTDDIVTHEWGHAYTQYTSDLVYQFQSGALNESISDIWGEVSDLLNSRGVDSPDVARTPLSCSDHGPNQVGAPTENSFRWLMGEASAIGALRDMWYPECAGDPGSVSSSQYWCDQEDGGGVHTNSGVPNRTFALMVDGNPGMGIDGLGITKSAHITWSVSNTLTPTSRFADYADALESACQALIGINLPALDPITGGNALSGEMINGADCEAVAAIIAVTELRTPPDQCQILDPVAPPLCESEVGQPSVMFVEDWESGVLPEGWTVGRRDVANVENFNAPDWSVTDALPAPGTGNYAAYGANLNDCGETGVTWLRSPPIQSDSDKPFVAIDHMFSIEYGYDGGNVKVIVNGESPMLVNDFAFNPYNDTILTAAGTSNPMSSEPAFTGSNPPASTPYWAQSQLSLEGLASAGDSVEFLFEMGTDECFGYDGWYIDRLQVYNCDSACGDAQLTGNEQCDDGNAESGDGCSATCQIEPGYTCTDPVPPVLTNLLQDPGFEDGPPHDAWNPSSSNFGTPLCDLDSCGYDGARTGSWFLWFGGYSGGEEEGSVSQTLVIPDTATELRLYKRLAVCDSGTDFAELLIDGNQLMVQSGDDPDCGESDYVPVTIDINAYADNAEHTITLHSVTYSVNGGPTNVFFDDLSLPQGPLDATPGMCQSIDLFKDGFEDPPP